MTGSTQRGGLVAESLRTGTLAGVAMIPFAAVFRTRGLRINEYGRKTLDLVVTDTSPSLHYALTFGQHLLISWFAAMPLLVILRRVKDTRTGVLVGAIYGAVFYVVVNSWALPLAFGDPMPWHLGVETVYPSLLVHVVYGSVVALAANPAASRATRAAPPP